MIRQGSYQGKGIIMTKIQTLKGLLFATMAWPFVSMPAYAQSATETVEADPAEIVVTANRRLENIVDVPLAVTAISGDVLNRKGLTQIENFVSQVPGFSIENQGRVGVRLILRGQNTGGAVGGATVASMIDDVILTSGSALSRGALVTPNLDLYDVERVEVLRGPQGTLYGANALGGLLKYVSRKPDLDTFGVKSELGIDSVRYGETGYAAKAAVNVPIASGVAALRVSGFANDVAGYVDNPLLGLSDVNGGKLYGGRAILLVKPSEALSLRLTAAFQKDRYGSEGITQIVGAPVNSNTETSASFRLFGNHPVENLQFAGNTRGSFEYYNGLVDYDFGAVQFISSTSYVKGARRFFVDASNGPAAPGLTLAAALGGLFSEPIVAIVDQENSFTKFNQELRLSSESDALRWQIGAFYSNEDIVFDQGFLTRAVADTSRSVTVLPFIPGLGGLGLGDSLTVADYEELSGFAEATFSFGERFELSVGGRYSNIKQTVDFSTGAGLFTGPVDSAIPTNKSSENKFTFSIAPRFELTEDISAYARVASGFRPGGPITLAGAGTLFPASFKPDSTVNYELGLKGSTANRLLTFDVAAFYIDWKDIQIVSAFVNPNSGQSFFLTGNAGKARSQGIEWAFGLRPVSGLEIGWTGAITDATLRSDAPGLGGSKGDFLPYVPRVTNAVNIDYSMPLSDGLTASFGGTWNHTGARNSEFSTSPALSGNVRLPSYDSFDLRAGLAFDRFRIDALVRNVTDVRGLILYRSTAGFNATTGSGVISQPRTFSIRLSSDF
jgi:iron complex outermembrane recepter protein